MSLRLWTWFFSFAAMFVTAFASLRFLHMLQLESYQGKMYRKWINRAGQRDLYCCVLVALAALFLRTAWIMLYNQAGTLVRSMLMYGADSVYLCGLAYLGFYLRRQREKKKLVFTGRITRLIAAIMLISIVFHMSFFISSRMSTIGEIMLVNTSRYLPGLVLPFFVMICYWITLPIENMVKRYYFNDAKRRLKQNSDLLRIGLTGSYGKTSTKYILSAILNMKYNTLITPGSFNTPMGVAKVVRGELNGEHEAFIAEMGARYKGDIDELCNLVAPRYGIITSVGKQHLETFGSFETVIETKSELLKNLPADGAAFVNGDIEECRKMYDDCTLKNKFMFGIRGEGLYMRAENISVTSEGSVFTLISSDGRSQECRTKLLGSHNILNITGAAALSLYLGLTMQEISEGIAAVEPVEHRLQLIQGPVTVIDDAFNANPEGAKAAMEVLSAFSPQRRIVVTPGMIELGDEQVVLNEQFGRDIAGVADAVILVGKQNLEALKRGLLSGGFKEENIAEAETLDDVTPLLPQYAPHGSVVLFENDLPDNYA